MYGLGNNRAACQLRPERSGNRPSMIGDPCRQAGSSITAMEAAIASAFDTPGTWRRPASRLRRQARPGAPRQFRVHGPAIPLHRRAIAVRVAARARIPEAGRMRRGRRLMRAGNDRGPVTGAILYLLVGPIIWSGGLLSVYGPQSALCAFRSTGETVVETWVASAGVGAATRAFHGRAPARALAAAPDGPPVPCSRFFGSGPGNLPCQCDAPLGGPFAGRRRGQAPPQSSLILAGSFVRQT
jgi:hypothetical protein